MAHNRLLWGTTSSRTRVSRGCSGHLPGSRPPDSPLPHVWHRSLSSDRSRCSSCVRLMAAVSQKEPDLVLAPPQRAQRRKHCTLRRMQWISSRWLELLGTAYNALSLALQLAVLGLYIWL